MNQRRCQFFCKFLWQSKNHAADNGSLMFDDVTSGNHLVPLHKDHNRGECVEISLSRKAHGRNYALRLNENNLVLEFFCDKQFFFQLHTSTCTSFPPLSQRITTGNRRVHLHHPAGTACCRSSDECRRLNTAKYPLAFLSWRTISSSPLPAAVRWGTLSSFPPV